MPSPPVVPGVMRFRITGTLSNDAAWGVRNYVSFEGGSPTVANMLTLCEAVAEGFSTEFMGLFSDSISLTAVDGVDLSATDGAGNTADVDYSGTSGGPTLPNQCAAVLKFDISRRYRGGKPKMFLPVSGGDYLQDESHFTSDFCDNLGAAGNSYNSYIKASYADAITLTGLVNVSFYDGFTSVENPITHRWRNVPQYRAEPLVDAVGGFTCDPVIGSQNRRRLA